MFRISRGRKGDSGRDGLLPKQVSRMFAMRHCESNALRSSESFFDNSEVRLRCKSKTRPSGSDSWICGRYAALRIVSEKILIRAQSSLFRPTEDLAQDGVGLGVLTEVTPDR